jgi:hypothetical protein
MIFKDIWGQKGGAISFLYLLVWCVPALGLS